MSLFSSLPCWKQLIAQDKSDLKVLLVYTVINGLLSLAVPLATQALVNTIAAGVFIQPLVVLTFLTLLGLLLSAWLRILEYILVEIIQQRIFARISLDISKALANSQIQDESSKYLPGLTNRFFDVLTIQKTWSKLLLTAPSAILQVLIGLLLLAIYSPLFLVVDFIIITAVALILGPLSMRGLSSSIDESSHKYKMAQWLQDSARCLVSFKMGANKEYLLKKSDGIAVDYVLARREHFKVLLRQTAASYAFRAIVTAGTLGLGGWLVINKQLTLGQLVAAEIIIVSILVALEKLFLLVEHYYDFLTGLSKVSTLLNLPEENQSGKSFAENVFDSKGASLVCQNVVFTFDSSSPALENVSFEIPPGARYALVGKTSSGKSTLLKLICGLVEMQMGLLMLNGLDVREASLADWRRQIAFASGFSELFEGSVEENILLGRNIPHENLNWALDICGLTESISKMPDGLSSKITSEGKNISRGQQQALLIARAIVNKPRLLILDEVFAGIDERNKLRLLKNLTASENPWTLLVATQDPEVVSAMQYILVLESGQLVETGSPQQLSRKTNSVYRYLFPQSLKAEGL